MIAPVVDVTWLVERRADLVVVRRALVPRRPQRPRGVRRRAPARCRLRGPGPLARRPRQPGRTVVTRCRRRRSSPRGWRRWASATTRWWWRTTTAAASSPRGWSGCCGSPATTRPCSTAGCAAWDRVPAGATVAGASRGSRRLHRARPWPAERLAEHRRRGPARHRGDGHRRAATGPLPRRPGPGRPAVRATSRVRAAWTVAATWTRTGGCCRFLSCSNGFRRPASRPATEVISYCGSGVSACLNLVAMEHAGLGQGRLYPGSWSQWSNDPARPVATDPGTYSGVRPVRPSQRSNSASGLTQSCFVRGQRAGGGRVLGGRGRRVEVGAG